MSLYIFCTAIYIFHPVGGRLAGCAACPLTLAAPRTPLSAGWAHWQILAGVSELSRVPELADPLAPRQASGSARPRLPAGGTMGTEGSGRPQPGQAAGGGFGSPPTRQHPCRQRPSPCPMVTVWGWSPRGAGSPHRVRLGRRAAKPTYPCSSTVGSGLANAILLEKLRMLSHSFLCKYHGKKT